MNEKVNKPSDASLKSEDKPSDAERNPTVIDFSETDVPDKGAEDNRLLDELQREYEARGCKPSSEYVVPDNKLTPLQQALTTYVASCVVLNRVYPCELIVDGEKYQHISFEQVSADRFVRLHKRKPYVSILDLNSRPINDDMEKKMEKLLFPSYEEKHGFSFPKDFNSTPNSIVLHISKLTDDMVSKILASFDRLVNQEKKHLFVVTYFTSDGQVEREVCNKVDADIILNTIYDKYYNITNPFIASVTDFRNEGQLIGLQALYHDGSVSQCFVTPLNGTVHTLPEADPEEINSALTNSDAEYAVELMKRMDEIGF